jgi:hypothetical protein
VGHFYIAGDNLFMTRKMQMLNAFLAKAQQHITVSAVSKFAFRSTKADKFCMLY